MRLTELKLVNFRCHKHKEITFANGITGIIGNNGKGKSSIIEAINFLFTGEGYSDKESMVHIGSAGQSYVSGKFVLNDKEGVITRYVNLSKVTLTYDGVTLHKAGEVKELWSKMLQIDTHIFKHVIIAHQKKMAELFSQDSAIREKVFQKIFMVPNTERLRNIIWDKYMTTCPPQLLEENITELELKIANYQASLNGLEEDYRRLSEAVLSEDMLSRVLISINHYNKCIEDMRQRPLLEKQSNDLTQKIAEAICNLKPKGCYQSDIQSLDAELKKLSGDRVKQQQYDSIVLKLTEINKQLIPNEKLEEAIVKYNADREGSSVCQEELAVLKSQIAALEVNIKKGDILNGKINCPTCGQSVKDLADYVSHLKEEARLKIEEYNTKVKDCNKLAKSSKELCVLIQSQTELRKSAEQYKNLIGVKPEEFNELKYKLVDQKLKELRKAEEHQYELTNEVSRLEAELSRVNSKLNNLLVYNGNTSPDNDLAAMQEVLDINKRRIVDLNTMYSRIIGDTAELQHIQSRLEQTKINRAYNQNRNVYYNKLRLAYDTLHQTKFPRALISTYSSLIETELEAQIEKFNFPYNVRISDEFKFLIYNSDGIEVPSLSGGQETIIGLCLRFALHSMFGQSFPMLVIDEGSAHLSESNKQLYFDCINIMRNSGVIKQLIIVDHDNALSEVVDHIIDVEKD